MLRASLERVSSAAGKAVHRQADAQFHLAIASLTESPLLIDAVTNVQVRLHEMLGAIPVLDRNIDHSRQQHDAIAEAILAGDAAQGAAGHGESLRRHRSPAPGAHVKLPKMRGTSR